MGFEQLGLRLGKPDGIDFLPDLADQVAPSFGQQFCDRRAMPLELPDRIRIQRGNMVLAVHHLRSPEIAAKLPQLGWEPVKPMTPAEFGRFLDKEMAYWVDATRRTGMYQVE